MSWRAFFLLTSLLACLSSALPGEAAASWSARYFLFDRAVWSPDGRTVGIVGRYTNAKTGETFEDTLLVDAGTGKYSCVSPSAMSFVLSRNGDDILFRGRWGLYHQDLLTGEIRTIRTVDPFRDNEIELFSYNRSADAAIVIRCSNEYPESSGVYEYPLDGGPERLLLADPGCGPQSLNYWQSHRRDIGATEYSLPRYDHPTVIENFPGTLWQLKWNEAPATAVWGNGPIAADTLCRDCRVEFNSWPRGGGRALVSTAPEDIYDVITPGDLWLLRPGVKTLRVARGRFEDAAWADSGFAYVMARPGRIFQVDALQGLVTELRQSLVPEWLLAPAPPLQVWTVPLDEVFASIDSVRMRAVELREWEVEGYAPEKLPDGTGYRLLAGAFPDSMSAADAAERLRKGRNARVPRPAVVLSRPVSAMQGQFDFGSVLSPDGKRRIYFRSHPHMFQAYVASEVWIQNLPDGRAKLVLPAMSNF